MNEHVAFFRELSELLTRHNVTLTAEDLSNECAYSSRNLNVCAFFEHSYVDLGEHVNSEVLEQL